MDALFANHLAFMANHRGSVSFAGGDVEISGPTPELTSFVPGDPLSAVPVGRPAVRLAPWSGAGWPQRLEALGYEKAETLTYMELADPWRAIASAGSIEVTVCETEADAKAFAAVQFAGFASGEKESDAWWRSYFLDQALRNYQRPKQRFYLGWVSSEPVTCTLVVATSGVRGIYAVATRPEFRRRGASAAVLERIRRDALADDDARLILQAMSGSYAEGYYAKLGFLTRYHSMVWRRPAG